MSSKLADRAGLRTDLGAAPDYEVLVTELKAAAVDVACEDAIGKGAEVVFLANRPVAAAGEEDLTALFEETIGLAVERFGQR